MSRNELTGKIQTVLGLIPPDDLGITLTHEHFFIEMPVWFREPTETSERVLAHQPVSLENLGWVNYHKNSSLDNLRLVDEQMAISEALRYKYAGGNSVVDLTSIGAGRDPLGLSRISRATGLNIIMGTGYYVEQPTMRTTPVELTEEMMIEEIVRDISVGVGSTGVRAGIIGEVGTQWPILSREKMSLRATAQAQTLTGAPVNTHPGYSPSAPFEIVEILGNAGADLRRVVISHMDRTLFDPNDRIKLARTGCYLEYDLFSYEGGSPLRMVFSEANPKKCGMPNDAGRINIIMDLIDEGFLNQILISHDHCMKCRLWRYGGPGYAHILENVVPLMQEFGMPKEHIRTILVDNPKRLLQFV